MSARDAAVCERLLRREQDEGTWLAGSGVRQRYLKRKGWSGQGDHWRHRAHPNVSFTLREAVDTEMAEPGF
jgi:hypothetical protein